MESSGVSTEKRQQIPRQQIEKGQQMPGNKSKRRFFKCCPRKPLSRKTYNRYNKSNTLYKIKIFRENRGYFTRLTRLIT